MHEQWEGFGQRIRRRVIRVLDVLSILTLDLVVLVFGRLVTWLFEILKANHAEANGSQDAAIAGFLSVAESISHGAFLLIYLVWVLFDLYEFFREQLSALNRDDNAS